VESSGFDIIKSNADLMKYFMCFGTSRMVPLLSPSVVELRSALMTVAGCKLTDLDGSKQALADNLERLTDASDAASPQKKQKTGASSSFSSSAPAPQG
jgi:hypothetical protein